MLEPTVSSIVMWRRTFDVKVILMLWTTQMRLRCRVYKRCNESGRGKSLLVFSLILSLLQGCCTLAVVLVYDWMQPLNVWNEDAILC